MADTEKCSKVFEGGREPCTVSSAKLTSECFHIWFLPKNGHEKNLPKIWKVAVKQQSLFAYKIQIGLDTVAFPGGTVNLLDKLC